MEDKAFAFTGHRPESLPFGNDERSPACEKIKAMMLTEILEYAAKGCVRFLAGGARGGDIYFAEQVLVAKVAHYPGIQLITVVPHEGQANSWTEVWRDRYFRILELSTDVITLATRYTRDCYHVRNRYLVDHADTLLALYNGQHAGGTFYTMKYAYQENREIIILDPNTLERKLIPPRLHIV